LHDVSCSNRDATEPCGRLLTYRGEVIFYGALVFLISFIIILSPHGYDAKEIWWHLKAGEWAVKHGIVAFDPFSHTASAWLNYNWLADLFFYKVYAHFGGMNALYLIAFVVFGGLICALVYTTCLRRSGCMASSMLITLLVTQNVYMIALKPHVFSYLFTAWVVFVIYAARDVRLIWTLPVVMVLWANMHIMFVFGWLAGLVMVCRAIESKGRVKEASVVFVLMLLAPLINPYGYRLYSEVWTLCRYGSDVIPHLARLLHLAEFSPPGATWPGYLLYLAVALFTLLFNRKRVMVTDAVLFMLVLVMSITQAKYVPYFAIISAGIVSGYIPESFSRRFVFRKAVSSRAAGVVIVGLLIVAGIRLDAFLQNSPNMEKCPVREVEALRAMGRPQAGKLFNTLDDGQYLIYGLHPRYRTFIDARLHLFPLDVVNDYLKVTRGHLDSERIMDKYDIDTVVLPKTMYVIKILQSKGWTKLYEGNERAVMQRPVQYPPVI